MNMRNPFDNLILNTDSYKASHWLQYPPGTDASFFYVESRGGIHDHVLFFGLQAILKAYFSAPITHADVDEARDVFAAHGEPFNEAAGGASSTSTEAACRCASAPCPKAMWCRPTRRW